jgi:predicted RNase H-like HicB family nuclease
MSAYRIDLSPDDNGTFLVTCLASPEVTTFGDDEADARRHVVDAIEDAIAARIDAGEDVPPNIRGRSPSGIMVKRSISSRGRPTSAAIRGADGGTENRARWIHDNDAARAGWPVARCDPKN